MLETAALLARATIRRMREGDAELVRSWRNSDRVRPSMINTHFITPDIHIQWVQSVLEEPTCEYWIFEYDHAPAGLVYFTHIDERAADCRWGFYLGATGLPRGIGTAMGYLALQHLFGTRGICRINADVLENNTASLAMHRKLGFRDFGDPDVTDDGRVIRHMQLLRQEWYLVSKSLINHPAEGVGT